MKPASVEMPDPFGDEDTRLPIEVMPPSAPLVLAPGPTVTDKVAGMSAGAICWPM
ncbi:Uncharacterised protein [Mycobacteroides abscessus subsp. abscessus]|nr:Uncharacterised protein [Mycobacteroides abscessus subsp. abscessus]